jgi:hypothetical protein
MVYRRTHQENIITGTYTGDPIAIGDNVTYTDVWVPTEIGAGVVKMNIIDIEWVQGEPITWTIDIVDNTGGVVAVSDFAVDMVNSGLSGTTSFSLQNTNPSGTWAVDFTVEIVELGITVADVTGESLVGGAAPTPYSYPIDPLPSGGALTMRITVTG